MTTTGPPGRLSRPLAATIGVLAVWAALGVGQLVACLISAASSPFLAVGDVVVRLSPEPLTEFAKTTFGTNDKLVLLTGMFVVITLVGAVAGLLSRRRPNPGVWAIATLSFADVIGRPLVERPITMTCVSNPVGGNLISTASFTGVPLRDILVEAGVDPAADQLFSRSTEGWYTGTPTSVVMEPQRGALLAIGMNGEALAPEHGFWLERGWSQFGPIKTMSRIDSPQNSATVTGATVTVAGIAWAQHTGIAKVEVRVDDGPWRPAVLSDEVSIDAWRMWHLDLPLTRGDHTAEARATDKSGYTQTAQPIPNGASGWPSVGFTVG